MTAKTKSPVSSRRAFLKMSMGADGYYGRKTGKDYDGVTGYHVYHDLLANKDIDAVVI